MTTQSVVTGGRAAGCITKLHAVQPECRLACNAHNPISCWSDTQTSSAQEHRATPSALTAVFAIESTDMEGAVPATCCCAQHI
eukprot:1001674-Pelagomonas_calceolata.AAC.5